MGIGRFVSVLLCVLDRHKPFILLRERRRPDKDCLRPIHEDIAHTGTRK